MHNEKIVPPSSIQNACIDLFFHRTPAYKHGAINAKHITNATRTAAIVSKAPDCSITKATPYACKSSPAYAPTIVDVTFVIWGFIFNALTQAAPKTCGEYHIILMIELMSGTVNSAHVGINAIATMTPCI